MLSSIENFRISVAFASPCEAGEGAAKPRGLEAGVVDPKCPGRRGRRAKRSEARRVRGAATRENALAPHPRPLPASRGEGIG
jgi:hypothetical protein